jgi:uncharacterized protein YecT (DUF1311 family)
MKLIQMPVLALIFLLASGASFAEDTPPRAIRELEELLESLCAKTSEMSRARCESQLVSRDRDLNHAFHAALTASYARSQLRAEQRAWLLGKRDACQEFDCAWGAMGARIDELQGRIWPDKRPRETPMTDAEARSNCETIARLASTDQLTHFRVGMTPLAIDELTEAERASVARFRASGEENATVFALQVRRNRRALFADSYASGTCSGSEVKRISEPYVKPGERWPTELIPADDVFSWKTWNGYESVISLKGRFFVISSSREVPRIVSWVTPAGTLRPLCFLKTQKTTVETVSATNDRPLCEKVADRSLPALEWKYLADAEVRALRQPGLTAVDGVAQANVDIDNDGSSELIWRIGESRSGGCGSHEEHLRTSPSDSGKNADANPLNHFFASARQRLEIYDSGGARYIFGRYQRHAEPPRLYKLVGDELGAECEFSVRRAVGVVLVLPLEGELPDLSESFEFWPATSADRE